MIPSWLNDTLRAFGRQAGIADFGLDSSGTAALRFENGVNLRFEYADDKLFISAGLRADAGDEALMKRFLTEAHPEGAGGMGVRASYSTHLGLALLTVALADRDVRSDSLENAFRTVFTRVERIGRARA